MILDHFHPGSGFFMLTGAKPLSEIEVKRLFKFPVVSKLNRVQSANSAKCPAAIQTGFRKSILRPRGIECESSFLEIRRAPPRARRRPRQRHAAQYVARQKR